MIRPLALAVVAAVLASAGFAPVSEPILVILGLAVLFVGIVGAERWFWATLAGGLYGATFIGIVMQWMSNLAQEAIFALAIYQGIFYGLAASVIWLVRSSSAPKLVLIVSATWTAMEFARERVLFGGLNWGAPGYSLGEWAWLRSSAQWIGTSGLSVLAVSLAASVMVLAVRRDYRPVVWVGSAALILAGAGAGFPSGPDGPAVAVAIVQGNSPCPNSTCADERRIIFENHVAMTRSLEPGTYDLVVWAESSTGFGVDPLQSSQVAQVISEEASRLDSYLLIGGDRADTPSSFVNSNLLYNRTGDLTGEYRKRHPVPFGEYIPFRRVLGGLSLLSRVPRDMVRGGQPGVFGVDFGTIGTVISYEGAFARYSRDAVAGGAEFIVVASNEASYGRSVASDQFIAMTRMRAAENGVDVVHAAITGSSTLITEGGDIGDPTPLYEPAIVTGEIRLRDNGPTLFTRWGDWVAVLTIMAGTLSVTAMAIQAGPVKGGRPPEGDLPTPTMRS